MQLRWTEEAASDLARIAHYLFLHAASRAPELLRAIYDAPSVLHDAVFILRILHGAQQWP